MQKEEKKKSVTIRARSENNIDIEWLGAILQGLSPYPLRRLKFYNLKRVEIEFCHNFRI